MTDLNNAQISTLDLLDATLDDMKDLPEWKRFPAGVYKVKPEVKIEKKKIKNEDCTQITVTATLIEVKELNRTDATPPEIGAVTSVSYTWENEYGQGGLKNLLKPIASAVKENGITKVSDFLQILGSADSVLLVMGVRDGKADSSGRIPQYQQFTDLILE